MRTVPSIARSTRPLWWQLLSVLTLGLATLSPVLGASLRETSPDDDFVLREEMVPMRDGVKLYTLILTPRHASGPLPILLQRTPYEAAASMGDKAHTDLAAVLGPRFAELHGYIWVFQDIRGRYRSEGAYVHTRPPRGPFNPSNTDETTDAWDTVDWLVKNVADNNGRVGMYGTSNPGWLVLNALLDPHPALKVAIPVNPVGDLWLGDDYFHNGAFRLSYAAEHLYRMGTRTDAQLPLAFNEQDLYTWFLQAGSARAIDNRYFDQRQAFWKTILDHPSYDSYWQAKAVPPQLAASHAALVPTMHVQGWFDQEDIYGAIASYTAMEARDTANDTNFLVAGPWYHGQAWSTGSTLGALNWDEDTAKHWRQDVLAPFLAHYLKDGPDPRVAPVTVFDTGSHRWKHLDHWPSQAVQSRPLYLGSDMRVGWVAPGKAQAADRYVSDPAKPVPYQPRPIRRIVGNADGRGAWQSWLSVDQRFVDGRPDVLSYTSEPLHSAVTVRGEVVAHLFAATTGTDADWVVKLIDVSPGDDPADTRNGGYQFMISGDILRGRYRRDFSHPQAIAAGKPLEYTIRLPQVEHTFEPGHRIMVQVQSSWFPLYDRNPQVFLPSIMEAKASDYRPATQTIYHDAEHPSRIDLQVVPEE